MKCKFCSSDIVGRHALAMYCNKHCAYRARHMAHRKTKNSNMYHFVNQCSKCKEKIQTAWIRIGFKKHCEKCRNDIVEKPQHSECLNCGQKSKYRKGKKYCSMACQYLAKRKVKKQETRVCFACNSEFSTSVKTKKYCSKKCKYKTDGAKSRARLTEEKKHERNERNRFVAAINRKLDPSKHRARKARRKALMIGANIGDLRLISDWMKSWQSKPNAICYWCGKRDQIKFCDADHITPLILGGAHDISNLCISCRSCNRSKRAMDLTLWNKKIDMPVLL